MNEWIGTAIAAALVLGLVLGFQIGRSTERARVKRLTPKKKRVDPRREPD